MVKMDDNSLMPFGKHKGEKLANLPAGYLLFIYDNFQLHDNLKKYIKDNMEGLKQEKKLADREQHR